MSSVASTLRHLVLLFSPYFLILQLAEEMCSFSILKSYKGVRIQASPIATRYFKTALLQAKNVFEFLRYIKRHVLLNEPAFWTLEQLKSQTFLMEYSQIIELLWLKDSSKSGGGKRGSIASSECRFAVCYPISLLFHRRVEVNPVCQGAIKGYSVLPHC